MVMNVSVREAESVCAHVYGGGGGGEGEDS